MEGSGLERELPTLGFFETLESDHGDGFVQRRGKAHERRPFAREAKARGEHAHRRSLGGEQRLREDRPAELGNTAPSRTNLPGASIPERGSVQRTRSASSRHRPSGRRRGHAARGPTAVGAERGESRGGYWKGETSESFNPTDGYGTKHGREDEGGTRRHEAEKA
jgi:hypothetical protein